MASGAHPRHIRAIMITPQVAARCTTASLPARAPARPVNSGAKSPPGYAVKLSEKQEGPTLTRLAPITLPAPAVSFKSTPGPAGLVLAVIVDLYYPHKGGRYPR